MLDLNTIEKFSTVIVAVANIILVIFVLIQIRDSRKPVIFTKILSREQEIDDRPEVLFTYTRYLTVLNRSRNLAKSLDISYQFSFNGRTIDVQEGKLSHLNPDEATKIVLKMQKIRESYPDSFKAITEGKITKSIPKETLKIDLKVKVRFNPLFLSLFGQIIEDNYYIEWGSLQSFPEFEKHPIIFCWNKRDGEYYIYKLGERFERREIQRSENW